MDPFLKILKAGTGSLLVVSSVENVHVLILDFSTPLTPAVGDGPLVNSSQAETYRVFCSWGYQSRVAWC